MEAKNEFDAWMARGLTDREAKHVQFCRTYAAEFAHGAPGHMDFMVIASLAAMIDSQVQVTDERVARLQAALADYAHDAWSGWMRYLFSKCATYEGMIVIPTSEYNRWRRQMETLYPDLPANEQSSDLVEASKMIAIMKNTGVL